MPNGSNNGKDGVGTDIDDTTTSSSSPSSLDERPDGEESSDGGAVSESDQDLHLRRLEDLSEGDFDSASESERESFERIKSEKDDDAEEVKEQLLLEQLKAWENQDEEKFDRPKPIKCLLCKKVLLLNGEAFRAHKASKKHKAKESEVFKELKEDPEPSHIFCFAEDYSLVMGEDTKDDMETHQERALRLRQAVETEVDADENNSKDVILDNEASKKRKNGKKKNRQDKKRRKTRPGRRQRALLKQSRQAPSGTD